MKSDKLFLTSAFLTRWHWISLSSLSESLSARSNAIASCNTSSTSAHSLTHWMMMNNAFFIIQCYKTVTTLNFQKIRFLLFLFTPIFFHNMILHTESCMLQHKNLKQLLVIVDLTARQLSAEIQTSSKTDILLDILLSLQTMPSLTILFQFLSISSVSTMSFGRNA